MVNSVKPEGDVVTENDDSGDEELWQQITYPSAKLGAITRKINQIRLLMNKWSIEQVEDVNKQIPLLMAKKEAFLTACNEQLSTENVPPDDVETFKLWCEQHNENLNKFISEISKWQGNKSLDRIKSADNRVAAASNLINTEEEISPTDSVSQIASTSSSKRSGTSSVRARLLERKIKLECDRKLLAETNELENRNIKAKEDFDKIQLQLKREKADLAIKYEQEELSKLEQQLDNISDSGRTLRQPVVNRSTISSPAVIGRSTISSPAVNQQNTGELIRLLVNNQALARLPQNEPEIFNGDDITKFPSFILAFDRTIVARCPDDSDKFYYLQKYTEGRPRELVASCNRDDPSLSYSEARRQLQENYGDEFKISHKYLEKLEQWPDIPAEDEHAMEDFNVFISTCLNLSKKFDYFSQLNSLKELKLLTLKLPWGLRKSFRAEAARKRASGSPINFETFVKFVGEQTDLLKLPELGDIRDTPSYKRKPQKIITNDKNHAFSTSFRAVDAACYCCGKTNHTTDNCIFFKKKTRLEKEDFIKTKNLCFGCLASTDHHSRDCKNRLECRECHKSHPTSLHNDEKSLLPVATADTPEQPCQQSPPEQPYTSRDPSTEVAKASCHGISVQNKNFRIATPAVPVAVKKPNSDEFVYAYAGLDTYATATYIDEEMAKSLGVEGINTTLKLTTMQGNNIPMKVSLIENLEIYSLDGSERAIIPLLYSKSFWPFKRNDSPSANDLVGYETLNSVPFNFIDEKIGILIGGNNPDLPSNG